MLISKQSHVTHCPAALVDGMDMPTLPSLANLNRHDALGHCCTPGFSHAQIDPSIEKLVCRMVQERGRPVTGRIVNPEDYVEIWRTEGVMQVARAQIVRILERLRMQLCQEVAFPTLLDHEKHTAHAPQ